ncbi:MULTISPECIES: transposase [Enterobacteriaceae]
MFIVNGDGWRTKVHRDDRRMQTRAHGQIAGSLNASRSHWLVESMHWMLDTAFGEDACRKRAEERAENFARIRQMCLNMLKSETTLKASIKHKRAMCAMDPEYLLKVLGSLYLRECS